MARMQNCSVENMSFDQACVKLKNEANTRNLWLYTLSSDCIACPYTRTAEFDPTNSTSVNIDVARPQFWRIIQTASNETYIPVSNKDGLYCEFIPTIGEFGIYELSLDQNKSCTLRTIVEPANTYIPLAVAFGIIILLLLGLVAFKYFWKSENEEREEADETTKAVVAKKRVRSIDSVRGMSILLMIFVNSGAGGYYFLEHATWDGLLIGDLVFPTFMWIMGVCIPLSISSQLSRGISKLSVCRSIVKRSLCLFCIGVALNTLGGGNQLEDIRIFGVLQRFSLAYLAVGIVYTVIGPRDDGSAEQAGPIRDISILLPQWVVALSVLAAHCAIVFLLPVPGCPKGYLGPGGRHADGKYLNCTGGATGYVDKLLLGENHIFKFPTADRVYGSGRFDPEGILGTLTSIFQVFLGVQAGQTMQVYKGWKHRLLRWLTWALVLGIFGASLHYSRIIPVNKNLWSISFVMVTTCLSLGLLSACYLLTDVFNVWDGGPFRIPGMNSTVMYIGHQIFYVLFPFHWKIGKMNTHGWHLAENLWVVVVWTCIAYVLHRKRIYVTL